MRNRKLLLICILLLTVGFSLVAGTIYLNGSTVISTNKSDFQVIFTSVTVDGEDLTTTPGVLTDDKKGINYKTSDLSIKGEDYSILQYTIANNSKQYDANITVSCGEDLKDDEYVIVTSSIDGETLPSGSNTSGTVRIDLKKSALEEVEDRIVTCDIEAIAIEKTN